MVSLVPGQRLIHYTTATVVERNLHVEIPGNCVVYVLILNSKADQYVDSCYNENISIYLLLFFS